MPWTCKQCGTHVELETTQACPQCDVAKSSWTVVPDVTRQLVVPARSRLECLRGDGDEPAAAGEGAYDGVVWSATDEVTALERSAVCALAAEGRLPAARDVLTVRVQPAGASDWTLSLGVKFSWGEVVTHHHPQEGRALERGAFDARFVCVHGPADEGGDPALPGLTLLDVSEDAAHAPELEVSGLKKRPQRLRLVSRGRYWLSARFHDRAGGVVAGLRFTVDDPLRGREAVVGPDGRIELDSFDCYDYRLRFDGGEVLVPAVHDPSLVCHVSLRFLAPDAGRSAPRDGGDEQEDPASPQPAEESLAGVYEAYEQGEDEGGLS